MPALTADDTALESSQDGQCDLVLHSGAMVPIGSHDPVSIVPGAANGTLSRTARALASRSTFHIAAVSPAHTDDFLSGLKKHRRLSSPAGAINFSRWAENYDLCAAGESR